MKLNSITRQLEKRITIIWFLTLIFLFWYLDYIKILGMIPQSIHFMRQTDSLSIIINYLKNGMKFWEPGILNLDSQGGRTASEFPIFYYLIAWLYKLTGEHEVYLRLFNITVLFSGFYFVFRLFLKKVNSPLIAYISNFLLSGSLVVYYYANNFLPDAAGLGFALIGIAVFYPVFEGSESKSRIIWGMLLMTIAALLKVSYFVYPTAFLSAIFTLEVIVKKKHLKEWIKQHQTILLCYGLGSLAVFGWVMFIRQYNELNHGYFLVKAKTFLDADNEDRIEVLRHVTGYWATSYYPSSSKYFMSLLFLFAMYHHRKAERSLLYLTLFTIAGSAAFFFLFFLQFTHHDYYFMAFIPTIIIGTLFGIKQIEPFLKTKLKERFFLIILLAVCIDGICYSDYKLWRRYRDNENDLYSITGQKLQGADKILDEGGISRDAKLLIVTDRNINGGLYFTKRYGWPVMDTTMRFMLYLPYYVRHGATHILLLDSTYTRFPLVKSHIKEKVLSNEKFTVYTVKK